jgi:hypothetical protein
MESSHSVQYYDIYKLLQQQRFKGCLLHMQRITWNCMLYMTKFNFLPTAVTLEIGTYHILRNNRLVDVCRGKINASAPVKKRIQTAMKAEHKASRWTWPSVVH